MIYLIHYNRTAGRTESLREFSDKDRTLASTAKLDLEISLLCQKDGHEVVLLEASTQEDLRKTHRRYFESLADMKTRGNDSGVK